MAPLGLSFDPTVFRRLLVLGAHSDDVEIGAGGFVRSLLRSNPELEVRWVVFAAPAGRAVEAIASAREILGDSSLRTIETHDFRDGFFPYEGGRVKEAFERIKSSYDPHLVLTHHRDDLHQDHRLVADLTWNTFRSHLILEYEIPKYDGGLGSPNFFVPLDLKTVEAKIDGLMKHFGSQRSKIWFTPDTFKALMRLRGIECRAESGYAEAFYARKVVWTC